MDLTTATPVEIDTALAEVYSRIAVVQSNVDRARRNVERYERKPQSEWHSYETQGYTAAVERLENLRDELHRVYREAVPFNAEFDRRGGWTRAFLVIDGHVHSSMHCASCYPTTSYGWLPEVSGHDEAEIVDLAGEGACTVCYPSAPVSALAKPQRLWTAAQREERAARDAEKVARQAKKVEKGLLPDGSAMELRWQPEGSRWAEHKSLKTARAAELFVVEQMTSAMVTAARFIHTDAPAPLIEEVLVALAAKAGTDVETVRAPLAAKAAKKAAKIDAEYRMYAIAYGQEV
jgi:hypothetical protein